MYIVSKMGSMPRPHRDISNVYAYLLSRDSVFFRPADPPPKDDPQSYYQSEGDYLAFQTRILKLEARILYSLSFDTRVSLPHPLAITYLQTLDFLSQPRSEVSRRTMQYLNTALLTPQMVYLTHQPHALATAAIYNAARDLGAKMPECEWWEVFDIDREELGFLVVAMRSLAGWMQKLRDEIPQLSRGMLTRAAVEEVMRERGLYTGNGHKGVTDEEQDLMQMMDSR